MRYLRSCLSLLLYVSLLVSCKKEKSFETDKTPSHGSLHSSIDDECLPKTVNGAFIATTALGADNYIDVEVDVTSAGAYSIVTDTVNGYYFKATGNFSAAGTTVIRLKGNGTPEAAGTDNFLVTFDSSYCYVPVVVLPAGTGAAGYTLLGTADNCMDATVSGSYISGTPLTLTNTVEIHVGVTQVGTYSITTAAVNGITFSGSGVFTSTGSPQTIILTGSGTPSGTGIFEITVSTGTSTCKFLLEVTDASTFDYFPRTGNSNWSYEYDDNDNDSLLRIAIPQTVTINGNTYNVFIQTDNAASGYDSSGYYRRAGGTYYEYVDIANLLGFDSPVWIEYIFLKDDAPAGTTWTSDPFTGTITPGGQLTLRTRLSILEKDVAVTVNGTVYPNTIVVEQRFEVNVGGSWVDAGFGTLKSYYSRDIGNIKQEVFDGSGNSLLKQELRRHEIH